MRYRPAGGTDSPGYAFEQPGSSSGRTFGQVVLGGFLVFAGVSHLTFARTAFYAQVPPWLPLNADFVVLASGVVEIALGAGLLFLSRWRVVIGWLTAALFVWCFPATSRNSSRTPTHSDWTPTARGPSDSCFSHC